MITVLVKKRKGSYLEFISRGHADYAEEGRDIVCAAVSALVITTVNSLESLTDERFQAEDGDGCVTIRFMDTPNTERTRLLMDSLLLGLTEIARNYHNRYLTVKVKEV